MPTLVPLSVMAWPKALADSAMAEMIAILFVIIAIVSRKNAYALLT
jgi:hypothetical protein